ncbi:MAG: hypothetical protein K9H84_04855 [Bacteroidales bacterium]|nr:hypothetical protein [Bacteroidales bacterium]
MKTSTLTITITATLIMLAGVLNAGTDIDKKRNNEVTLEPEVYIDDVPCNTAEVIANIRKGNNQPNENWNEIQLPEESYVSDVEIDTQEMVMNYFSKLWSNTKAFAKALGDEFEHMINKGYLDQNNLDISRIYHDMIKQDEYDINLEEEPYVNDVPFDTKRVVEIHS